jgi:hypothetical protein
MHGLAGNLKDRRKNAKNHVCGFLILLHALLR